MRALTIEGQKEMHAIGVRRRIRIQAGYCFPSLRGKSCFFLEFPTCRLLEVGVRRVNRTSRQFEEEFCCQS